MSSSSLPILLPATNSHPLPPFGGRRLHHHRHLPFTIIRCSSSDLTPPSTPDPLPPTPIILELRRKAALLREGRGAALSQPEPPNYEIGWKRTKPINNQKPKGWAIADVVDKLEGLMGRQYGSAELLAKVGSIVAERARAEADVLLAGGEVDDRMVTELSRVLKLIEMDLEMVKAAVKEETLAERIDQARASCPNPIFCFYAGQFVPEALLFLLVLETLLLSYAVRAGAHRTYTFVFFDSSPSSLKSAETSGSDFVHLEADTISLVLSIFFRIILAFLFTGSSRLWYFITLFDDKMQNEEGQLVDLYIPRKCSATNRLIAAKDHAAVQINIGHLDEHGVYTRNFTTFALSGFIRAQGDADSALDRLWQKKKSEIRQQ
ncbi:hypothetical protein IEQ34_026777 [Dendrobium chrysotoxum]|uniref:Small ribosomal subunit protein eS21 n=2 Tax=Dendrobium TaxID=37818 RepID=A0AAV7FL07_DENCH|nr:hypothetical protein IEQ34_026777 [Dendrobium chrysotoxum]